MVFLKTMKAESSEEIKRELKNLPPKKLMELLLRVARFKKENKELLSFLLFSSDDLGGYVDSLKIAIDEELSALPKSSVYLTKKTMRKILRMIARQNRYMGSKWAYAELMLHFCKACLKRNIAPLKHQALYKIWRAQVEKISDIIPELDEDLQFDFRKAVEGLV
jgi:hypothetical protein